MTHKSKLEDITAYQASVENGDWSALRTVTAMSLDIAHMQLSEKYAMLRFIAAAMGAVPSVLSPDLILCILELLTMRVRHSLPPKSMTLGGRHGLSLQLLCMGPFQLVGLCYRTREVCPTRTLRLSVGPKRRIDLTLRPSPTWTHKTVNVSIPFGTSLGMDLFDDHSSAVSFELVLEDLDAG